MGVRLEKKNEESLDRKYPVYSQLQFRLKVVETAVPEL